MSVVVSPLVHNRTQILDHFPNFRKACPDPAERDEAPSATDSSFFFMVLNRQTFGRALYLLVVALLAVGCQKMVPGSDTKATEIMVFAAASLRDATSELEERFLAYNSDFQLFFNYAGSNTLARQIISAPIADIFICANEYWMDEVESAGRVVEDSRVSYLSNQLVVIANVANSWHPIHPTDICRAEFSYLALANPDAVPAGRYAKEWLEGSSCGMPSLWEMLRGRIASALDVRSAMSLVESDPSIIGIVYKTDAAVSEKVRVVYEIPRETGPMITYSMARIKQAAPHRSTQKFYDYLIGSEANEVFKKYGFVPLTGSSETKR